MTYSIVARDAQTGELGIAVQSRFFAAGRFVPWIEVGVGVIASQAFANPNYGPEGLRLLRSGLDAHETMQKLVNGDGDAARRQVAVLDAQGRVAVHTGRACVAAAGHSIGTQCAAQANMMTRPSVWPAMLDAFERASGDMAERLLCALEAAEREGGDLRGKQAAALIVVSVDPSLMVRDNRVVDLRVDDHPDPVGEIRRELAYSRAHQRAMQSMGKMLKGDLKGAFDDLNICVEGYPEEPEFLSRRALVLFALGRSGEAREQMERASAIHNGWAEFVLRLADAGIVPVPRTVLEPLVQGLA